MRYQEYSNSQRQKAAFLEFAGSWGRENRTLLFIRDRVSVVQNEKRSGDWSHNHVNALNTTEQHT